MKILMREKRINEEEKKMTNKEINRDGRKLMKRR